MITFFCLGNVNEKKKKTLSAKEDIKRIAESKY